MSTQKLTVMTCIGSFTLIVLTIIGAVVAQEMIIGMLRLISLIVIAGSTTIIAIATISAGTILTYKVLSSRETYLQAVAHRQRESVVIATRDSQVFIPTNGLEYTPAHLPDATYTPLKLAAWQMFHNSGNVRTVSEKPAIAVEAGWPKKVDLFDLLPPGGASLSNIVLGVTMEAGKLRTVAAPLSELVHIICAGASGWGKSMAIRSIAYQLATAPEPVNLILMDREGITFSPFANCSKLMYPLADEEDQMIAILQSLIEEKKQRKEMFHKYPTVEKLSDYNHLAGEPLPPVVCMIDEATSLMDNKSIEARIRTIAQETRKYGIYLLLSGQSMKADTISTDIRDQFSTILQMKTNSRAHSQILLHSSVALRIKDRGRGYAILAGKEMIEIQMPHFSLDQVNGDLNGGTQDLSFPKLLSEPDETLIMDLPKPTEKQEEILGLWDTGGYEEADITTVAGQISNQVYDAAGGRQRELVMNTLKKFNKI